MKGTEDTLEWEHYQKTDHKLSETKLRLNLVVNYHKSEKGTGYKVVQAVSD